jgi:MFS family permease
VALTDSHRSLRNPNYRRYFAGQVVSLCGTWAQQVGMGWLVLELSGDKGAAIGLVTALQFVPVLLFGLWAGLLADRFDKRRFIVSTQSALAVTATALAVLDLTGTVTLPMVYALSFLFGVATALDTPARLSFVVEMVGPEDLPNALALNSAVVNAGRIIGPAIAGVVIAIGGTGLCFLVNGVSYLGTIAALITMNVAHLQQPAPVARGAGQVRAGLVYAWRTPILRASLLLTASVSLVAFNYPVLLPLLAKVTFEGSASSYGAMLSAMGVGAFCAALVLASIGRPYGRRIVLSVMVVSATTVLVAVSPSLPIAVAVLALTGVGQVVTASSANALVQLDSRPEMRGRVTAIFSLMLGGMTPVGAYLAGMLADLAGPRWALAIGGVGAALALAVFGPRLFGHHRATHVPTPATESRAPGDEPGPGNLRRSPAS